MWQVTDRTEATSFVAELFKCGTCAKHLIVYERQKPSKPKSSVHENLRESYSFLQERTQFLRVAIDVLDIFQLSDVYQMKMYAGPEPG